MKTLPGQLYIENEILNRVRWIVHGEYANGETVESYPFETEDAANQYKNLLSKLTPSAVFRVKEKNVDELDTTIKKKNRRNQR